MIITPTEKIMPQDYDVVIVGSGTAGQTAAYDLMEGGLRVAVVEESDRFLDLEDLSERIVFVGGGFISFESARFAARLGPGTAPTRFS
ncbi:MAG: hypothetical protein DRH76_05540 [Deltaproteobacteria bacterium]|nr:MAG: hypothetical protein DRH76_05540 [Deltaproteobacteria bacterium]